MRDGLETTAPYYLSTYIKEDKPLLSIWLFRSDHASVSVKQCHLKKLNLLEGLRHNFNLKENTQTAIQVFSDFSGAF